MHTAEFYKSTNFVFSFEVMPPRNGNDIECVFNGIKKLQKYNPKFITITQSTSNSLRGGSAAIAANIKSMGMEPMNHVICANKSKNDIENELIQLHYLGVKNILVIRGDPPWGENEYKKVENGLMYGYQLVQEIQKKNRGEYIIRGNDKQFFKLDENAKFRQGVKTNFCVAVAGYPEGHRECKDPQLNIEYLKKKVDEGANLIITQMFYNVDYYFKFVKECRDAGITVPIIPGVMPILFYNQINFLKETCAVTIPDDYLACLEKNTNNKEKFLKCSVDFITKLCDELMQKGVPGLHLYTLNNFGIADKILSNCKTFL